MLTCKNKKRKAGVKKAQSRPTLDKIKYFYYKIIKLFTHLKYILTN